MKYHIINNKGIESKLFNIDNIKGMNEFENKYFDIAIIDPPYGIGASEMTLGTGKNKKYKKGENWDNETPTIEFFKELFRVSKNQIIFGANYFSNLLPNSRSWVVWDKVLNKQVSFGDGELAWTSYDRVLKIIKCQYSGFLGADVERIHPTQKPEKLYDILLSIYAESGMRILDTHSGSGSLRISCYKNNMHFIGFETNENYFENSIKRFKNSIAQTKLF